MLYDFPDVGYLRQPSSQQQRAERQSPEAGGEGAESHYPAGRRFQTSTTNEFQALAVGQRTYS